MNLNLTTIKNAEYIGDSLSAINPNFQNLDAFAYNLSLSSEFLFKPFSDYYENNKSRFDSFIETINTNKTKWDYLVTNVSKNSSQWINPIVYIDPKIYDWPPTLEMQEQIINNFKELYPVTGKFFYPTYVEKQKAIIYFYINDKIESTSEDTINSEFANCVAQASNTAIYQCKNEITKPSAKCSGKDVSCQNCQGPTCQQSITVRCNYEETGLPTTNRYIQSIIKSNFSDGWTREIRTIILEVNNCEWTFSKLLIS